MGPSRHEPLLGRGGSAGRVSGAPRGSNSSCRTSTRRVRRPFRLPSPLASRSGSSSAGRAAGAASDLREESPTRPSDRAAFPFPFPFASRGTVRPYCFPRGAVLALSCRQDHTELDAKSARPYRPRRATRPHGGAARFGTPAQATCPAGAKTSTSGSSATTSARSPGPSLKARPGPPPRRDDIYGWPTPRAPGRPPVPRHAVPQPLKLVPRNAPASCLLARTHPVTVPHLVSATGISLGQTLAGSPPGTCGTVAGPCNNDGENRAECASRRDATDVRPRGWGNQDGRVEDECGFGREFHPSELA